jgi:hypothetical protein
MTDLNAVCMIRRNTGLVPADIHADDFIALIPMGKEVMVTVRRARNPKHHRLLFALLKKVIDNTDQWASIEHLLDEVKLATGLAEVRINLITGKPYAVPGSISFAAMGQDKFEVWFEQAVVILAGVLGVGAEVLRDEILAMTEMRS